jgi:hypothetical protein
MIQRTLICATVMGGVGFTAFAWMLRHGWSEEAARNPRARSAKLRAGIRTAAAPMPAIVDEIGLRLPHGTRH